MKTHDLTAEQKADHEAWVKERPPSVRALAERFQPNELYKLKTTGQRVAIVAFSEDGTLRVAVLPEYNPLRVFVGHNVFGIKPADLEDLPEDERKVIAAECAAMVPVATDVRDGLRTWVQSPEGVAQMRELISKARDKS